MDTERERADMKRIIVDIDNTLWDFTTILYIELLKNNYRVLPPDLWIWDFTKDIVPKDKFREIVLNVHLTQSQYKPYGYAASFLNNLKQNNYFIIIASNRQTQTLQETEKWLKLNKLSFDDIYVGDDKCQIFTKDINFVVDDSPSVLEYANSLGIHTTGIEFTWNRYLNDIVPLYKNLKLVEKHILQNANAG